MTSIQLNKKDKNLTWGELADDYDACHSGCSARTLSLDYVFDWAKRQKKRYRLTEEGVLCYIKGGILR